MAPSKDVTVTFKCSEQLADLVGKTSFKADCNKSELIRCCLLLGIDTVKNCPSLVNRIQVTDRAGQ